MNRLAVLGASGHGKVVADCAEVCGWQAVDFFDDAWPELAQNGHWSVVGNSQSLLHALSQYDGVIVAIGNNRIRSDKLRLLRNANAPLVSLIHPGAIVSRYVKLGLGSVVFASAVINVDTCIATGAIINTSASIDHDCLLADCVHVSPGARLAGGVTVGDRSWIGIGSSVRQGVAIGSDVVIGAGAAVVNDISNGRTVVGVPAR